MTNLHTIVPYVLACILRKKSDGSQDQEVLLIHRSNTGFGDNQYGLVGGKIDEGETPHNTIIREIQEEVGISVDPADVELRHVLYFMGETRACICFGFIIRRWQGVPDNREPEKHDHIVWFAVDHLPANMLPRHARIVVDTIKGNFYKDEGF